MSSAVILWRVVLKLDFGQLVTLNSLSVERLFEWLQSSVRIGFMFPVIAYTGQLSFVDIAISVSSKSLSLRIRKTF